MVAWHGHHRLYGDVYVNQGEEYIHTKYINIIFLRSFKNKKNKYVPYAIRIFFLKIFSISIITCNYLYRYMNTFGQRYRYPVHMYRYGKTTPLLLLFSLSPSFSLSPPPSQPAIQPSHNTGGMMVLIMDPKLF